MRNIRFEDVLCIIIDYVMALIIIAVSIFAIIFWVMFCVNYVRGIL